MPNTLASCTMQGRAFCVGPLEDTCNVNAAPGHPVHPVGSARAGSLRLLRRGRRVDAPSGQSGRGRHRVRPRLLASPICGPSRMSLLTERQPHQNQCWLNTDILNSGTPTFAHALGAAGYRTALVGRMHFSVPIRLTVSMSGGSAITRPTGRATRPSATAIYRVHPARLRSASGNPVRERMHTTSRTGIPLPQPWIGCAMLETGAMVATKDPSC